MSRMVEITVNGIRIEAQEGRLLLPVLLENGFGVPYFCYHEALGPDGNCRMCMVEIEGSKRPQISCDTFVSEGMEVRTEGESIESVRRRILELELINHPVDCPVCDKAGECSLQNYYMEYGLYGGRVGRDEKLHAEKRVDLGRGVLHDRERCVLCQRCVRFCRDIVGSAELCVAGRGERSYITTVPGRKLENDYAVNIVDLCPVGALSSVDFRFKKRVWFLETTESVCHGCERNCSIYADHAQDFDGVERIYRFRPRRNDEINGHFICDEGRFGYRELEERHMESCRVAGADSDEKEAEAKARELIERASSIVVTASADLYLEEMKAISEFALKIGASLHIPLDGYDDPDFSDEWLKCSCRASNRASVLESGIDTAYPKLTSSDLLINFDHPHISSSEAKRLDIVSLEMDGGDEADVTLPLSVWSRRSGTMISRDGVRQYCGNILPPARNERDIYGWIDTISRWKDES